MGMYFFVCKRGGVNNQGKESLLLMCMVGLSSDWTVSMGFASDHFI